jgi:hypothetical protein
MKYKTLFRLALKIVGILLVAQAIPILFRSVIQTIATLASPATGNFPLWYLVPVAYALQVGLGIYLFFAGEWIVNRAIPSNRAYCHECAYELRGLPTEGLCPECGTPYQHRAVQSPEVAPPES